MPPTRWLASTTGSGVWALAAARRYTSPETLTVWLPIPRAEKPLVPVPSEARAIVAVPLLAPALLVSTPTLRLLLSVAPAPNRLKLPAARNVAGGAAEIGVKAFAEAVAAAVLVRLST